MKKNSQKPQFNLEDKINVLRFTLEQLTWKCLTPEKQRSILFALLVRLRLFLVSCDEKPNKQEWERTPSGPVKYRIRLSSQLKLIDVDSGEEFTSEPVTGFGCSTFIGSEEETMNKAMLEASFRAKLKFINNLL